MMKKNAFFVFTMLLLYSCDGLFWPEEPTFEYEIQKEYEESCISDSISKIKGVFQNLSDSMCKRGFDYFHVNQTYHYSSCNDVKFKNFETFSLTYQRKRPVLFSEEKKADQFLIDITKHVFTNYVHDSIFLHYNEFTIADNFWHKTKVIKRDSLFQLVGFKVIKTGRNEFKRINR
jgi:hypothetical protein